MINIMGDAFIFLFFLKYSLFDFLYCLFKKDRKIMKIDGCNVYYICLRKVQK
jgi:hypothetical protein